MHAPTGYGQQTGLFVPALHKLGWPMAILAYYGLEGAATVDADGVVTLPRLADDWGNDVVGSHAKYHKAELVVTLVDPYALDGPTYARLPWCAWTPVDSEPLFPPTAMTLQNARWVWAMSRFGEEQLHGAGLEAKTLYVPHGIDTGVFTPLCRAERRAKLANQWEVALQDKFVVAMVSANKGSPSRKGFFEAFAAFKVFSDAHPDALLYMHTDIFGLAHGEHLPTVQQLVGLEPAKVIYAPQYHYMAGMLSPKYLADVYNAADVLLLPSRGEGFGLPLVEAQAAGCPAIATDFSAMAELVGAGWKVPGVPFMQADGATMRLPLVGALVEALEAAYEKRGDENLRAQARNFAVRYDYRHVLDNFMLPALEQMAAELDAEGAAVTDSRRRRSEARRARRDKAMRDQAVVASQAAHGEGGGA